MTISQRQLQKAQTHKKIMDTAYLVFSQKGFTATTTDVAKEAGVSHGTIFAHFPTLNDLLTALLSDFETALGMKLHELSEKGETMGEFLAVHLEVLEEYEDFYSRLITQMDLLPEQAKYTFAAIQTATAFHFGKVAGAELEKGAIKEIPIPMLFNTWLGLVHYYLQNREFFSPQGSVIKLYKTELIKTYLQLISKEE